MPQWPRQREVFDFYGQPGTQQTTLHLPFPMKIAWDKSHVIKKFSVHRKVHDSALRCFVKIAQTYSEAERTALGIDLFGGCLNVRKMRGGNSWSMHSWGIAIDFDPERNPLRASKKTARLAKPDAVAFWNIWEAEGWTSLGRKYDFDFMHVEATRGR